VQFLPAFQHMPSMTASSHSHYDDWTVQWTGVVMMTACILAVVGIITAFFLQNTLALVGFVLLGITGLTGFWVLKELQVLHALDNDMRHVVISTHTLYHTHKQVQKERIQLANALRILEARQNNCFLDQDPKRIKKRNEELRAIQSELEQLLIELQNM